MQHLPVPCRLFLLSGLIFFAAPVLHAQMTGELPAAGAKALETLYNKNRAVLAGNTSLLTGQVPFDPKQAKDVELATILAQYHTYRYTWSEARNPNEVKIYFSSLDADLNKIGKFKPNTQPFLDELTKQVVAVSKDMLSNREPLARVNYVRVLARFAQEGMEEVGEPMVAALKDPDQNDGVKYWALEGLRELFVAHYPIPPAPPVPFKSKKLETDAILTLIGFIEQKPPALLALLSADEVEGVRVLRREAVKALAASHTPALVNDKKELAARPAQVLMRVIAKEGFVPEVRFDEQAEAALGLCMMRNNLFPDYQPDAAARFIGLAVGEVANAYVAEKEKDRGWKVYASRFTEAFAVLKTETDKTKGLPPPAAKYVNDVIKDAGALIRGMETKANITPANFTNWVRTTPSPNDQVYKGVADSVVKFPEGSN